MVSAVVHSNEVGGVAYWLVQLHALVRLGVWLTG